MRKRKLSSVGLAAILTASLISGGIFAWFISQDAAAQVVLTTPGGGGTDTGEIVIDPLVPVNPGDVDPGVVTPLVPEDPANPGKPDPNKPDPEIINKGDQPLVLELDLSSKSVVGMLKDGFDKTSEEAKNNDWLDEYDTVYTENDVTIGSNTVKRYTFSEDRLKEVVKLSMDITTNNEWVTVDSQPDMYYTVVKPDEKVTLKGLSITVLGELGGLKLSEDGTSKSVSRQFEQKSEFRAVIYLTSMVSQEGAISSQFGDDVLQALKDKGFEIK